MASQSYYLWPSKVLPLIDEYIKLELFLEGLYFVVLLMSYVYECNFDCLAPLNLIYKGD